MPSTRQDSLLLGLLLGLVSLAAAGCAPESIDLVVDVMGLPQNAAALRISASLNGLSGPQNLELKPAPKQFVLRLPNDSAHQGEVLLDITALGVAGCVAGTVQHRVAVSGAEATVMTTASLKRNQLWPCPSPTGSTQNAIWGSAPDDVYAVGDSGSILHFDGASWTQSFSPVSGKTLRGVGGNRRTRVFAAGEGGTVIKFDGSAWRVTPGVSGVIRITGVGSAPPTGRLFAISVDTATVGSLRQSDDDGGTWTVVDTSSGAAYNAGWGATDNDGWVVGDGGRARRFVSGTAMPLDLADGLSNYAIWGSSASDVWVAGAQGRIAHRNGASWDIVPVPSPANTVTLRAMSGSGPSNILCAGDVGTVLLWNGSTWQALQSGTTKNLFGVFMNTNGTAWITGEGNLTPGSTVLLHYDPK